MERKHKKTSHVVHGGAGQKQSCAINSNIHSSSPQPPPSHFRAPSASSPAPSRQQASDSLTILHFNDVYNIEGRDREPVGGAARFKTCLDKFRHLNPLTLFSGDALSPSNSKLEVLLYNYKPTDLSLLLALPPSPPSLCIAVSVVMKGEQMVPVLNFLDIQCAVYGNHDFGRKLETL
jgi:5'-nucleotidase